MPKKQRIVLLVLIAILILGGGVYGAYYWWENYGSGQYVCTGDLKICPNGSVVGHIPPNCEFAKCPEKGVSKPSGGINGKVCTQEAKLCPDGSAVGRSGKNCEFAKCPEAKADETANWQTYKNDKYGFEIKYPKDWESAATDAGGGEETLSIAHFNNIKLIQKWRTLPLLTFSVIKKGTKIPFLSENKLIGKLSDIINNGAEGTIYKGEYNSFYRYSVYITLSSGNNILISLSQMESDKDAFNIFREILSTFKFTK